MSSDIIVMDVEGELYATDGSTDPAEYISPTTGVYSGGIFGNGEIPVFAILNGKLYFAGHDDSQSFGPSGLWSSDGTSASGSEITGVGNENASGNLLGGSSDLISAFGELLFDGDNASGVQGLWVSNGLASGATQLAGVGGAYAGGVFEGIGNPDFTLFDGSVMFEGRDAAGDYGLWLTDGKGGGTHEVDVSGAAAGGIFAGVVGGQSEADFTVIAGGKMIFSGVDAGGFTGLWVTAAANAAPTEITGVKGVWANSNFIGGSGAPPDFTAYGDGAVFQGFAADGTYVDNQGVTHYLTKDSLWFTDGTAAGTFEIPVPESVSSSPYNPNPIPSFGVLGTKLLFAADDSGEADALWVLDGPKGTPTELKNIKGAAYSFEPTQFVNYGGSLYFAANDSSGNVGLWRTDGSVKGTVEVKVLAYGTVVGDLTSFTMTVANIATPSYSIANFKTEETTLNTIVGGFDLSGAAAAILVNLAALELDASHIDSITATGLVTVQANAFSADSMALDKIVGGFVVSDTTTGVAKAFNALEKDIAHVHAIEFTNSGTPTLVLTAAQDASDRSLLAKIKGDFVLEVHNANGSWTTTGHGDHLTIDAYKSSDTITGGGGEETFVLKSGFGDATIEDFHSHLKGSTHDILSWNGYDSLSAMLNAAIQHGANLVVADADGVRLTLDDTTKALLRSAQATDFKWA